MKKVQDLNREGFINNIKVKPMLSISQFYLFLVAALVILLIPGPAVLYVVLQSVKQGHSSGVMAMLGLELGTTFHVATAAYGVSTLSSSSALIFNLLKYSGTAYLMYLGVRKLLPERVQYRKINQKESFKQVFWQGVMVEMLNPKTMLFFFAFLPQFVDYTKGDVASQMVSFGFLFVGLAVCIDSVYVILASSVKYALKSSRWFIRSQRYLESSVYIGLGFVAALSSSQN
jgi:threonine/homoserine/homoserine lactone efflux protein